MSICWWHEIRATTKNYHFNKQHIRSNLLTFLFVLQTSFKKANQTIEECKYIMALFCCLCIIYQFYMHHLVVSIIRTTGFSDFIDWRCKYEASRICFFVVCRLVLLLLNKNICCSCMSWTGNCDNSKYAYGTQLISLLIGVNGNCCFRWALWMVSILKCIY